MTIMEQSVIRFTRQLPMPIRGWEKVRVMIIRDCRIRRGKNSKDLLNELEQVFHEIESSQNLCR